MPEKNKFIVGGETAKLPADCTLEQPREKLGKLLEREPSAVKIT